MKQRPRPQLITSSLFSRLASKSLRTIAFRGRQEMCLKLMHMAGSWQRLERRIAIWTTTQRALEWNASAPLSVLAPDGKEALCEAADQGFIDSDRLIACGDAVMKREFSIFGAPLPMTGPWPWHQDWRFGHEWIPQYFRNYMHYAPRPNPYDVKFPWELSRLFFLQKLIQADILAGEGHRKTVLFTILKDWNNNNPLAYSVNWYPMEGAMRGIELCIVSDMLRQTQLNGEEASLLLKLLAQHGEFVMRTIEFTDNAGNHYAAELVALLLLGQNLKEYYPNAQNWYRFAVKRLGKEILRQILPDGVNFEKSTAYHRLVQDLFLLGCIALERYGNGISDENYRRLKASAMYNAAFMRPDKRCPLIGDSDDAVVFVCDNLPVRDHRPSLGVAALVFKDAELKAAAERMPAAGLWLFGKKALVDWRNMPDVFEPFHGHHYFDKGGMVVSKSDKNYLIVDVGEVGQNGRLDGHGHNDILSFELFINGKPIIIDPGSYLYSGDTAARVRFHSTWSHNSVMIDAQEIAPFGRNPRNSDQARPLDVDVRILNSSTIVIQAGHTGYKSLPDPVDYHRTIFFDRNTGALKCNDRLEAAMTHHAVRLLHFAPGLEPALGSTEARIKTDKEVIIVSWDARSRAKLIKDQVCPGFGRLEESKTLEIQTKISKEDILRLEIYPEAHGPLQTGGAVR